MRSTQSDGWTMRTLAALIMLTPLALSPQRAAAASPPSTQGRPRTPVDCAAIAGTGTSFYENSRTYTDPVNDEADWKRSTPEEQGMDSAKLDAGLKTIENNKFLWSVLVVRNDRLVYERYLHGSAANKSNNIHSASKSMLRMLVAVAVRDHLLAGLDTKVSSILPDYFAGASQDKKNITVRHLLTMSAGLKWTENETESEIEKKQDWVKAILELPQAIDDSTKRPVPPGQKFLYNTGLTHVLSAVLTKVTGMSTCDFAHRYLFDPLRVTAEHWGRDPRATYFGQKIYSGGYNLYMTPREMAKFGLLMLHRGATTWYDTPQQIVPPQDVDEAHKLTFVDEDPEYAYGQLFWLRSITAGGAKHDMYFAWGYGGQFIYVIPDLNIVFVTSQKTTGCPGGDCDKSEIASGAFIRDYLIPSIR